MTLLSFENIQQRGRTFVRLRAAERTLTPSLNDATHDHNTDAAREFRVALNRLKNAHSAGDEVGLAEALGPVDVALDRFRTTLLECLDAIPFPQLRATVPEIAQANPEECLALVDLILSDWEHLIERRSTLEYLITLLCSVDDGRYKRVAIDPVTLTPFVRATCKRIEGQADAGISEVELELHQAAVSVMDAPHPRILAREIRRRKDDIGLGILAPGVLRALVAYNVKLANVMRERLEDERQEDLNLALESPSLQIESEESDAIVLDSMPGESAGNDPLPPFAEAPGVVLVHDVLRRLLQRLPLGSGDSEVVALSFDLSLLKREEIEALLCPEPDEYQSLVWRIALLGCLIQSVPTCEERLRALDIMPETLTRVWLVEIDKEAKALVQSKIAVGDYGTSRKIADLQARFLYEPLAAKARELGRKERRSHEGDTHYVASEMHEAGRAAVLDLESSDTALRRHREDREREDGGGGFFTQWSRRILPWAAAAVIVFGGVNFLVARANFQNHDLSLRQLLSVSNYLASASWDDKKGPGPVVIGRIDESYLELSAEEQMQAANEITSKFAADGVIEVVLYDEQRELVIHYADGKLRRPFPPKQGARSGDGSS